MGTLEVIQCGTQPSVDDAFARGLHDFCAGHGVDVLARPVGEDEHPLARIVVVRDVNGALVGGARVHERHALRGFPAESALRQFIGLRNRVRTLAPRDTVELTALWTTAAAKHSGIARLVAQACIACAISMGKRVAFIVSHDHFGAVLGAIGMSAVEAVDAVPFPLPSYRSRLYTADLSQLAGAAAQDREIIAAIAESLRTTRDAMTLRELTSIEQGHPSWTIRRRTTTRMRSVA